MPRQPHCKLTMNGKFIDSTGAQVEIFSMSSSWGVYAQGSPGVWVSPSQASLNAVAADSATIKAITDWFSAPNLGISHQVVLDQIKFASIGVDGKYIGDSSIAVVNTPGGIGSAGSKPTETAVAVSLRTATRGPKGRGRFYVPATEAGLGGDWRMVGSPGPSSILSLTHTMLDNVQTAWSAAFQGGGSQSVQLVVASAVAGNVPVTLIEVGDVMDTIRRRRDKLRENYAQVAFP